MQSITFNTVGKYLAIASVGLLLQACGGSSSSSSSDLLGKVDAANGVTDHTGQGVIRGTYKGKEVCKITQNGKTTEEPESYSYEVEFLIDFDAKQITFSDDEFEEEDIVDFTKSKGVYKFKINEEDDDSYSSWSYKEDTVFSIDKDGAVKLATASKFKEKYKEDGSVEECTETGTLKGQLDQSDR